MRGEKELWRGYYYCSLADCSAEHLEDLKSSAAWDVGTRFGAPIKVANHTCLTLKQAWDVPNHTEAVKSKCHVS